MIKKQPDEVTLHRGERTRRRKFPWWIVLLIFLILAGGLAYYVFQGPIRDAFTPPATLPPTISSPSGQGTPGILYQANFDDTSGATDWETFDDGRISAKIADGALVVGVNAPTDTGTWSGLNYTFQDFVLDVDATKLAGPDDNGIFIVFRLTDKENYNRFDISSDGYYALSVVRDGIRRTVSEFNASPAIQVGNAVNHLRLSAIGDTFRFEVNGTVLLMCWSADPAIQPLWDPANPNQCLGGTLLDSWQNADISQGKIGLGAQGILGIDMPTASATVAFDNLVIKTPDAP
jgi:hypothetical protein